LPCEDCTAINPGIVCRKNGGEPSCGCDVQACTAQHGCCEAAARCVTGATTAELCGTHGLACQTCRDADHEVCGSAAQETGRPGKQCCVNQAGAYCGPNLDLFGRDFVCCDGLQCVGGRCQADFCRSCEANPARKCCDFLGAPPFCCLKTERCCPALEPGQISFCGSPSDGTCCQPYGYCGRGSHCCPNGRGCCGNTDQFPDTIPFPDCCDHL
jgi:hypothetical protein